MNCAIGPIAQCLLAMLRAGLLAVASCLAAMHVNWSYAQEEVRLLDREPFDRVVLDAENNNAAIDTVLLDLPNRKVPDPLPQTGQLELRRLSEPTVLYEVNWSSVEKVLLYEQLLLNEAERLVEVGDLGEAYEYLQFLRHHYSDLPQLDALTQHYLRQDAVQAYTSKRYDEAISVLMALYDMNPRYPNLDSMVKAVSDRMITDYVNNRQFAAARKLLDSVKASFPQLSLDSIREWESRFRSGARRQLEAARQAIDEEQFQEARQALSEAEAILPDMEEILQLRMELEQKSPQVVVGVPRINPTPQMRSLPELNSNRIERLTTPKFVELVDFGAEGGTYRCHWAALAPDPTGLQLEIELNEAALNVGISPEALAIRLVERTRPDSADYSESFAVLFGRVEIFDGKRVTIHWKRPHVRPESLLQIPLSRLTESDELATYLPQHQEEPAGSLRYELQGKSSIGNPPKLIVERTFPNEEAALAALTNGHLEALDQLPVWQVSRLENAEGIEVSNYRMPIIHVLIPNHQKLLLQQREFRRALCYGIDRERIVRDILLGGESIRGFQVLSGPFSPGIKLSDPIGYAYNQELRPRPYEPRLASVLATVARNAVAKLLERDSGTAEGDQANAESDAEDTSQPVEPLVLAYPPSPIAQTACQTIRLQLNAIGIPIELLELGPELDALPEYDLLYTQLTIWEPVVDARQLLGPQSPVGFCSPSMNLALRNLDLAENWQEVRTRLAEVHRTAYFDLPVIPLWQTVDYYAHQDSLAGLGDSVISLYQNILDWRYQNPEERN